MHSSHPHRLMQIRREKEVMHENRVFREHQYAQRRQKDYEEALAREYELCERAREEYKEQTALQLQQHKEILAIKNQAKHVKNLEFVKELIGQILALTFKVIFHHS